VIVPVYIPLSALRLLTPSGAAHVSAGSLHAVSDVLLSGRPLVSEVCVCVCVCVRERQLLDMPFSLLENKGAHSCDVTGADA